MDNLQSEKETRVTTCCQSTEYYQDNEWGLTCKRCWRPCMTLIPLQAKENKDYDVPKQYATK